MNGVEILNEYAVNITPAWVIVVCMLGIIGAIIFAVTMEGCISEVAEWICLVCAILCITTSLIVGLVATCTDHFKEYSHIEYKVTIDDSVPMNEFLDKYEIIDQEGKIYTVKERE